MITRAEQWWASSLFSDATNTKYCVHRKLIHRCGLRSKQLIHLAAFRLLATGASASTNSMRLQLHEQQFPRHHILRVGMLHNCMFSAALGSPFDGLQVNQPRSAEVRQPDLTSTAKNMLVTYYLRRNLIRMSDSEKGMSASLTGKLREFWCTEFTLPKIFSCP